MAAVIRAFFDFGGSDGAAATNQDLDGLGPPMIRFKRADDATIDNQNPIPVPAAGTNYSRWKQLYLKVDSGTFTQIDNIRFYTDTTPYGTGIALMVGEQFPTNNVGAPESGYFVSDTDDEEMVAGHGGITTSVDFFGKSEGSPLVGPSISEPGSVMDAIGEMSDYVVLQMEVISTATAGDLTDENLTFKYDEI